jgi:ribosomal protein S18 acetylase RimI-like enzyme
MADLIADLEMVEIDAFTDLYRAAPADTATAIGLSVAAIDDAQVLAVNTVDVLAMNRVVGLAMQGESSEEHLSRVVDAVVATRSPRFFFQIAPLAGHEALCARLETRGLRHYNNWMRLHRELTDLEALPAQSPDIDVRRIGPEQADVFGRIVAAAFGYPAPLAPLTGQVVGRPRWHHYLAYEEETPIAAAAMYLNDAAAWFGFAATDAAHRRRGGQRALVLRRLRDAAAAGCRWVSIETAEDTVTRDAPSFRNLRRLGFEVAYRRPNYLWTRG